MRKKTIKSVLHWIVYILTLGTLSIGLPVISFFYIAKNISRVFILEGLLDTPFFIIFAPAVLIIIFLYYIIKISKKSSQVWIVVSAIIFVLFISLSTIINSLFMTKFGPSLSRSYENGALTEYHELDEAKVNGEYYYLLIRTGSVSGKAQFVELYKSYNGLMGADKDGFNENPAQCIFSEYIEKDNRVIKGRIDLNYDMVLVTYENGEEKTFSITR